ncbi:hypothetical protein EON80_20590 [bacterium]|nr:MAG: hypothetical protein EON80_20590 [bacterium]
MSQSIGFVGLGTMGLPMARNLSAKGYKLRLYNRTQSKAEALAEELGATVCASLFQNHRVQETFGGFSVSI